MLPSARVLRLRSALINRWKWGGRSADKAVVSAWVGSSRPTTWSLLPPESCLIGAGRCATGKGRWGAVVRPVPWPVGAVLRPLH